MCLTWNGELRLNLQAPKFHKRDGKRVQPFDRQHDTPYRRKSATYSSLGGGTMASQSQGIQQLLIAEKKAAEKVAEARKRKARRIKQARDEAKADIEKYRDNREAIFKEFETKHLGGKEEIAARIDKDTEILMQTMGNDVQVNKAKVIEELIALVTDIQPEIHKNYFIMNPKPKSVKK